VLLVSTFLSSRHPYGVVAVMAETRRLLR
jgi:hypothetical protein